VERILKLYKKALITGALGHIGSKLIEEFDATDIDVTIVDDLSTQRYCSLFGPSRELDFKQKRFQDLTVEELKGYDTVVHLAGKTDAAGSINKEKLYEQETDDAIEFVIKAEKAHVKNFVYPSTTSVYGKGKEVMYEDLNFGNIDPQSPYAKHKHEVEKYLLESSSIASVVLRLGTIFGTSLGMRFHTAINSFCWKASFKQPLTVWKNNIDMVRPYLGIGDACKFLYEATVQEYPLSDLYNVVSENVTLNEILTLVRKHSKNEIELDLVDTPLLNQHSYFVDAARITQNTQLDYKDKVSKGIKETMRLLKACPF
jgi:UDP-glucose 4-epimerase